MTDSARVDSWTSPALTSMASGVPPPSVTTWNFDPNPPARRSLCCGPTRGRRVRRRGGRDFFVSPGRRACGADGGAIDAPQFPIDVSVVVELHLQRLDDPGKDAALAPFAEVVVHRLPRAVSLGQVTPRGAG